MLTRYATPQPKVPIRRRPLVNGASRADVRKTVEHRIRARFAGCSYAFYFNKVRWRFQRGTLTLDGRVPTFRLKHALAGLLRDIEHIDHIINQVQAVSAIGLSSVRPK